MIERLLWVATALAVVALAGCGTQTTGTEGTPHAGTPSVGSLSAGTPSVQAIWTETVEPKVYQGWEAAPGYETAQPAKGPHGKSVQVFINPPVVETLAGPTATAWPVGSIIVKDALDASGDPESVEYMQKTSEGWYFAAFQVDGTVVVEGVEVEPCQECHAQGQDSMMSVRLP